MNRIKLLLFFTALSALTIFTGEFIAGKLGILIGLVLAGGFHFYLYWHSDKFLLHYHNAQPLPADKYPWLIECTASLAARAGLPMPKLYIINDRYPNAFATGRSPKHGVIAVTSGMLKRLNHREAAGVIAHELAHIKRHDTLLFTIITTISALFAKLIDLFLHNILAIDIKWLYLLLVPLWLFIAYLCSLLLNLAISRACEFLADEVGAQICGDPLAMAEALRKMELSYRANKRGPVIGAHQFIICPATKNFFWRLLDSHPPTAERITRLKEMKEQ